MDSESGSEDVMGDLIFVAVVVAFFAVTVAYVRGCERIVGRDEVAGAPGAVDTETADAAGGRR
ncbi:MAG TPA: hypothetical protein VFB77_17280 [Acidimicrobiales bacterium]|nr:hypothetical protein [Acidimicrobiales bacterium]